MANSEYTLEAFREKLSSINDLRNTSFKCEDIEDDRIVVFLTVIDDNRCTCLKKSDMLFHV